jgi:hypothetical protein
LEIKAEISKHKYAFAIPAYEGNLKVETALSLLDTTGKLAMMGVKHAHIVVRGGALIHDVRNELVHRFLHLTDCDTMICIDADIQWDWDSMLRLMVLSEAYPIVAGCYPARVDPVKFIVNHTKDTLNEHGLVECNGLGMGFVAIQRRVLEEMKAETFKHKDYEAPVKYLFQCGLQNGAPVGEDVWFLREAYKQGFPCMVDPGINLIHHGQKAYDYKFQDYVHQILRNGGQPLGDENGV